MLSNCLASLKANYLQARKDRNLIKNELRYKRKRSLYENPHLQIVGNYIPGYQEKLQRSVEKYSDTLQKNMEKGGGLKRLETQT